MERKKNEKGYRALMCGPINESEKRSTLFLFFTRNGPCCGVLPIILKLKSFTLRASPPGCVPFCSISGIYADEFYESATLHELISQEIPEFSENSKINRFQDTVPDINSYNHGCTTIDYATSSISDRINTKQPL